jgi:hypothetical protein
LFDGNYQELSLGLDFRMPIGYRRELANVRNAQVKLAREIGRLEDMELDASRELTEAFQALALNQQVLQQAWDRWRYVKVEEEHFRLLQDAGVQKLDVALDAQQRLAQAEVQFYTSLAEYNKAIALIHRRKGTTLAYSGIEFSEGPWSGKAYLDAQEHARRRAASRQVNYGWTRPQVISQGEQSTPNGNVGYPFDSRTVPQTTEQTVTGENVAPSAIQEIETEQVPAREAPNYDSMPTPSEKTRFRNQPTPAVRQTGQFLGHPAQDDRQPTVAHVSYEQRIDGNQNPEPGNVDRQRPLVTSNDSVSKFTEPRRHIADARIASLNQLQRPSQTQDNNLERSQMNIESPVVLSTFTPERSMSSEEPRVDWDRMERLGLERQSNEGSGNTAQIHIRN